MRQKRGKRSSIGPNASRFRAAAGLSTPGRFSSPNPSPVFSTGFTLRDEARNTASHQATWGENARLRQKPVAFVSAGVIEPLKDSKSAESSEASPERVAEDDVDTAGKSSADRVTDSGLDGMQGVEAAIEVETVDVEIAQEVSISASGDEIPRKCDTVMDMDLHPSTHVQQDSPNTVPGFFFDLAGDRSVDQARTPVDIPVRTSSPARSDSSEEVILFRGRSGRTQGTLQLNSRVESTDHVAVNSSKGKAPEHVSQLYMNVAPNQTSQQFDTYHTRPASQHRPSQTQPTPEEDEEEAILADYIANMAAQSDDDSLSQVVETFNTRRDLGGDDTAIDLGSPDNDLDEALNSDDAGGREAGNISEDDEASDLDDEALAQLFAKQEELGMGADELLLFSGAYAKAKSGNVGSSNQATRSARLKASLLADAFDDMDLADWNQAIFPAPGRARRSKQPPIFNVSDSELEMALKTAWQTDRERKKNRKMERELLRSEGLLGKNVNPDDLRVKYQSHMTLDDIKTEIVSFLLASTETVQFPPMDKQARKVLHEIARKFSIKSKSIGNGDQRRPVLYRTKRTVTYATSRVGEVTNHVEMASVGVKRKHFHRLDNKGPAIPRMANRSGGHKAVTYREGEIVGASAPQLGQENKGHAMLEKMGWSKGMGLGSLENKGILEPVAQVVKRSKAGLG